jgi:hypothetical protein
MSRIDRIVLVLKQSGYFISTKTVIITGRVVAYRDNDKITIKICYIDGEGSSRHNI